ncbi:HlyD family secretion protein [Bradyrhizobium sp. AZCC 1719]|uniref:efflux RND transporter periplasmic adaptor subunit n=1 Tax=Bradyrhizobium sp. AZCC 1719 TaxID=3117028 RepID=UPI002FF34AAA
MRRLLITLLAIAAATAGTFHFFPHWSGAPAQPSYRLAKANEGEIVATVNASGTINPTTTVIVGSQLSGRVVELLADYNSNVKAGQVVARLNSDQILAKLDAARADLEQARAKKLVQKAQIERVRADTEKARAAEAEIEAQIARNGALLADAERTYQRQSELRARGVSAEATHDAARTTRDAQRASLDSVKAQLKSAKAQLVGLEADQRVAEAQLAAAAAQVAAREATVRQIEVDLRNTDIRSPVSGVVVQRQVELGQTVAAALQSPTLFLVADDLRQMEISANIDEADVGRIKSGQRATFTVGAFPGRTFEGSVKQVRLGSQTIQNVVIYTAIVSIENPRLELLPGMTATLRIETDRRDGAVQVPSAALRWRPPPTSDVSGAQVSQSQGSNLSGEPNAALVERNRATQPGRVFVVGPDGKPQGVTVRIGATEGAATEIVSGLEPGREVIIGGGPRTAEAKTTPPGSL